MGNYSRDVLGELYRYPVLVDKRAGVSLTTDGILRSRRGVAKGMLSPSGRV